MKKLLILFAAAIVLGTSAMSAQTISSFRSVSVGLDRGIFYTDNDGRPVETPVTAGALFLSFMVANALNQFDLPLFLEYGASVYWMKYDEWHGYHLPTTDAVSEADYNILSFRIPVNLLYRFNITEKWTLTPYAGVNGSTFIFANRKSSYTDNTGKTRHFSSLLSKEDYGDYAYNRLGLGAQGGLRVGFKDYFASVRYEKGLSRLNKDLRMDMLVMSLGLNF